MDKIKLKNSDQSADSDDTSSLNFKISSELKREFKGFAVARGMTMTELLIEGFRLSKEELRK